MNPKRDAVEQAIADLKNQLEKLRLISKDFTPSIYDPPVEKALKDLYKERIDIANSIFDLTPLGRISRSLVPNPSPIFSIEDFYDPQRNKPLSYPIILDNLTKSTYYIDYTISIIDGFIEQLERKLKNRKDLQVSDSFQLTEAKLKQMILESLEELL